MQIISWLAEGLRNDCIVYQLCSKVPAMMGILKVTAYSYFICWVVSAWWSCLFFKLFLILGFCNFCLFHCVNFWASHCLYRLLRVWSIQKIPTEGNTQIHCLLRLKEQSCSWTELNTGSYPGQSMSVLHYDPFIHLMIHLPFETFARWRQHYLLNHCV